jgi:hypothetical protein
MKGVTWVSKHQNSYLRSRSDQVSRLFLRVEHVLHLDSRCLCAVEESAKASFTIRTSRPLLSRYSFWRVWEGCTGDRTFSLGVPIPPSKPMSDT